MRFRSVWAELKRSEVCGQHEDDALDRYLATREEEHEPDCGCRKCWKADDED